MWYEILPGVLNMSLTAGVIIVFVLPFRLLLKRAPKIYSYALWSVVLFRLLCPVSFSAPVSLLGMFDAPVVEQRTSSIAFIPSDIVHTEYPEVSLPVPLLDDAINASLPQGEEQLVADPLEAPTTIATYVWMLGILGVFGYGLVSYCKLRRKLVGAMQLRGNIYLADHIQSPFVMGLWRPRIYLPSALEASELKYIILHEQHHIRRLDPIFKMLAYLALCVHWFNPLVWVAFVLSSKDMEMSCDEAVVKKLGEDIRAEYSASLLQLATGQKILFGTPLAFGEGEPSGRIRNLARFKKPTFVITLAAVLLCVVCIVGGALNPFADTDAIIDAEENEVSAVVGAEDLKEKNEGATEAEIAGGAPEASAAKPGSELSPGELQYGDIVLTSQPAPEQVSIRVQPSILREYISYYYIPEGKDQQWLQDYMNSLPAEGEPWERRWEGKKETGWQIVWQDKRYMVFEGGYLYCSYRDETEGMMEYFVEAPKLCDYIQILLVEELDYDSFDPAEIKDVISAKLEVQSFITDGNYYNQTITDPEILERMEGWFRNAEYVFGGLECCNEEACLELTLASGEVVRLSMAADSCPNFAVNGVYYDYQPAPGRYNQEFYGVFDEIPWEWMESPD